MLAFDSCYCYASICHFDSPTTSQYLDSCDPAWDKNTPCFTLVVQGLKYFGGQGRNISSKQALYPVCKQQYAITCFLEQKCSRRLITKGQKIIEHSSRAVHLSSGAIKK
jgi:hypothetical protein